MISRTGAPSLEELKRFIPGRERLERGPVAIIECIQEIPCDPCSDACPKGAVKPFTNINDLPEIDFDLCDGCGNCIFVCPGLAIFVVDMTYSQDKALLKLPHEFLPLPKKGEMVKLLNRLGEIVADGEVVRSIRAKDKTGVVWVTVPKEFAMDVRAIAPESYLPENPLRDELIRSEK